MPALELQDPPWWGIAGQEPLNTRTFESDEANGARFKVLWKPLHPRRIITADSNSNAEASFCVPFAEKATFEGDTLGYSEYTPGQNYLNRRTPLVHGDPASGTLLLRSLEEIEHYSPATAQKFVMSDDDGDVDIFQFSGGWPAFEMTMYRGLFSQRSYFMIEDDDVSAEPVPELKRYITKFPECEAFHRKVTQWQFTFDDNPTQVTPAYGSLPQYSIRFHYVSYQWPWEYDGSTCSVPIGTIGRTLGKVNASIFDPDMVLENAAGDGVLTGFPAEELLYRDCKLSNPYRQPNDKWAVDIRHIFDWNPYGWQKAIRPDLDTLTYGLVSKRDSSPPLRPFQTANFDRLFMPRGSP